MGRYANTDEKFGRAWLHFLTKSFYAQMSREGLKNMFDKLQQEIDDGDVDGTPPNVDGILVGKEITEQNQYLDKEQLGKKIIPKSPEDLMDEEDTRRNEQKSGLGRWGR